MVPSDPNPNPARRRHARHRTSQLKALDVSPLCSPAAVFSSFGIDASWLAARFLPTGAVRSYRPFARPQRPLPLDYGHSGVNVPGLILRVSFPSSLPARSALWLPDRLCPRGATPGVTPGQFLASSPFRFSPNGSASCLRRSPLPLGSFRLPQDQSVQPPSPPARLA